MSQRPPASHDPYTDDTRPMQGPPRRMAVAPPRHAPPIRHARPRQRPLPRQGIAWRRLIARTGIGVIVLLLLACVGVVILQQQIARAVAMADVRPDRPLARPLFAPMNILLAGVDSRPDHPEEGIRSDSLLLLHLDPGAGWANLLSIPRDSLATIPGYGDAKINTAFGYGYATATETFGPETEPLAGASALAADTVEEFLGLRELGGRVNYMATVDFDGFAAMIDALGGIEVDVPQHIVDDEYPTANFGTMRIEFEAGRQRLDGTRALQYVRTRHADSDFDRSQRQQQVLSAISAELRAKWQPARVLAGLRLMRASGAAIRTTIPAGRPDALLLGLMLLRIEPAEIGQFRITPDTATLLDEQGSDLLWEPGSVQRLARQAFSRPAAPEEQATIQVLNSAGIGGLAGQVTALLDQQGFTTATADTGEPAERSVLLDFTGKSEVRRRLQERLNGIPIEARAAAEAPPGVDLLVVLGDDYQRYLP